jgi:hypothetical protein
MSRNLSLIGTLKLTALRVSKNHKMRRPAEVHAVYAPISVVGALLVLDSEPCKRFPGHHRRFSALFSPIRHMPRQLSSCGHSNMRRIDAQHGPTIPARSLRLIKLPITVTWLRGARRQKQRQRNAKSPCVPFGAGVTPARPGSPRTAHPKSGRRPARSASRLCVNINHRQGVWQHNLFLGNPGHPGDTRDSNRNPQFFETNCRRAAKLMKPLSVTPTFPYFPLKTNAFPPSTPFPRATMEPA